MFARDIFYESGSYVHPISARDVFYHFVEQSNKGLLIVSHDRVLLNKVNTIVDITTKGMHCYGGNYDFYRQQKDQMEVEYVIDFDLLSTRIPSNKMVCELEHVAFRYDHDMPWIFDDFNFKLTGPQRIALLGRMVLGNQRSFN